MATTSRHVLQVGIIKDAVGRREEYNRKLKGENLKTEKLWWIQESNVWHEYWSNILTRSDQAIEY